MSVLLAMIRREYWVRVRRRGFLIGTVLTPLLALAVFVIPILAVTRGGGHRRVAVLDQSGDPELYGVVKRSVEAIAVGTRFHLERLAVPADADLDAIRQGRREELLRDSDQACLVLRADVLAGAEPEYFARNVTDASLEALGAALGRAILERRLTRAGMDPSEAASAIRQAHMRTIRVSAEGDSRESGQAFFTAIAVVLTIFSTILAHSGSVLHGVVEEKESRIVEVMLTAVEPHQMMLSKLVGIGLVGITQYAIWGACLLLVQGTLAAIPAGVGAALPSVGTGVLLAAALFFVLGYALFATLYLILGAMASRAEDAQQLTRPLVVLGILPWLLFYAVLKDPNGTFAVTLSLIPFFTPTMMMVRIVAGSPPLGQVVLSIALTTATIAALQWVAARVYRAGILLYGKRLTLGELGRWLRHN